jgi:hypothetical protein
MLRQLLAWTMFVAFPLAASAQGVDEEYTKKIREYTADPSFLTELVDHLPASDKVPTTLKVLGYVAGAPDRLTYAKDVHRYFRELAKATPRVRVWSMGQSEEGREMILAAISDEGNMQKLDRLKEITSRLADPRKTTPEQAKELVAEGKPIYWFTGAMHSPETGSPEMLMELAYRLAVEDTPFIKAIRENAVVLITPVLDVDGRERMVDIYRYRKENPGRTPPPLLYWGHYVAHDNNRDAIGMALKLTQNLMVKSLEWCPTVLHDLHESVPFLYISTGTGPYNAWLDPIVVDEWHQMAYHEISELTARGVPGVWTHGFYDGWAPNYMFYAANGHNSIGRFYETFGNGGADTRERTVRGQSDRAWFRPNPPLPKVQWSHRNNVDLMQSGALLALKYVADHREKFLQNFYLKSQRSIAKATTEGPAAYIIPADEQRRAAVADFVGLLRMQGVETQRATAAFKVKQKGARTKGKETEQEVEFQPGTYVIRMDQPYSRLADMLLDTQYYNVNDPRPYDDTGWTLGALHNLKTVRVTDAGILKVPMAAVSAEDAVGQVTGTGDVLLIANRAESQLATLRFRFKDVAMEAAEGSFEAGGRKFAAGSFVVRAPSADARERLTKETQALGLDVLAVEAAPKAKLHAVGTPRIALVHDWMSTQDEGWWRIAFDHYGVPYEYVSVQTIRKTPDLRARWDVLVFGPIRASLPRFLNGIQAADAIPWTPSEKYPNLGGPDQTDDIRGGIGYEGLAHLRRFAEEGGLIVAAPAASVLAVQAGLVEAVEVQQARGLRAQGGVYRATVADAGSPIAYGYGDTVPVYFSQAPLFNAGLKTVLGGGRGGMAADESAGRPSGRGGPKDVDIPQGRPYVPAPEPPKPPEKLADVPEEQLTFMRHLLPTDERLPRVVLKFAKKDDLWISGMLDKPEELAERPAVIDCPVGKGHVVLFANNPMWRYETHGSHALVFNAILHWDQLATARDIKHDDKEKGKQGDKETK